MFFDRTSHRKPAVSISPVDFAAPLTRPGDGIYDETAQNRRRDDSIGQAPRPRATSATRFSNTVSYAAACIVALFAGRPESRALRAVPPQFLTRPRSDSPRPSARSRVKQASSQSRPYQYANSKTEAFRRRPFLSSNNADRSNERGGRGLPDFVAKGGEPPIPLDSTHRSDSTRRRL
jgi:hypothetical protein